MEGDSREVLNRNYKAHNTELWTKRQSYFKGRIVRVFLLCAWLLMYMSTLKFFLLLFIPQLIQIYECVKIRL